MFHSVLTGDIVNSTLLDPEQEQKLMKSLQEILSPYQHEFFRGDSFQVYLKEVEVALKTALLCRSAAIRLQTEPPTVLSDVRISIGIGGVNEPIQTLATAKGEAFLLSGRALDTLEKTEGRLVIVTENKVAALAFGLIADYINSIYRHMTAKQAEVTFELLNGFSQQQVADKLNKSKSTISQHVTAGRWDEIENLLNQYKNVLQLISL